ncbi:unnamed protein product [Cladocopium goreaui]|uniref:G-protein coupled receptor 125 n=1 Tax=Cladocopium goreaui TaxID=2562237 RepID=A0A9P1D190_9DINO|nr:unnamed protein product [Cladocopium goreaui]
MSTRRVHLATGPVDIVVDNSTAGDPVAATFWHGDVIATVQSTLPDQPWHGKTLLSSGPRRFDFSDHVDAENSGGCGSCGSCGSCDLVLANFSVLAPPRRGLHIATEKSGITIPQIQQLLDFVFTMVNMVGACRWAETFGDERGRPLSFEAFNLYHANYWIIGPATAVPEVPLQINGEVLVGSGADTVPEGSNVDTLLGPGGFRRRYLLRFRKIPVQTPGQLLEGLWQIVLKPRDLCGLSRMHGLNPYTSFSPASASTQPFENSAFQHIGYVEERDTNSLLLDVAATDLCHVAHVITDGLVGAETRVLPILGLLCKSRRGQSFPMDLLQKGLSVDIATAQASKEEDKTRILNSVRCPRARTWALDTPFPTQHPRYDAVNKALASHFALTSIQQSYRNGQQAPSTLWQALRSDAERRNIQVSLTGCHNFQDPDLRILIDNLPSKLQSLRLDLAYTGLERLDDLAGASFGNALQTLVIRFAGSLRSISGLSALLCPSLRRLELWLSDLPDLEDIELGISNKALLKLRLEELVLYVNGCPSVPRESKTALFAATRQLKQCLRRRPYMWVHIEDTNTWTLNLCLGKLKVGRSQSHLEIGGRSPSSPTPSAASLAEIPESQIDPFPCHCCTKFHGNSHGYCDAHRLARFYHNAFSRCHLVFQYAELLLIFFVQATADIESRGLLALIVISLYPVLWMSLDRLVGSATSICVVLISLLFASVSYALLRFDRMHRATLELSLASEAICSQAIRPANLSHLSLVFGSSADDFPNTDLRQSDTDLTSNFRQARIHFLSFQNALRRALGEGEVTNATANAKIKRLADLTSQGRDHDVLSCEIHCESLQQVQLVWLALSKRFQGEEEPWKIVALWDGFAQEEERRCSKIVMSMNGQLAYLGMSFTAFHEFAGYLATVVLCVASLTRLQSNLSELCLLADAFGLLEDAKPRRWLQRDGPNAKGSSSGDLIPSLPRGSQILAALLPVLLLLARFVAMITAAYFTCQYFFRYGPSSLHESIGQLGQHRFVKVAFGERFDGSWWDALCLSGPYAVLVVVFARDLFCFSAPTAQKRKSRQLSRIVYDRYFGVEGTYYTFKVALLQLLTILLQAFGKLHLLGGIALFAEQQRLSVAESLKVDGIALKVTFWLFWALLFCNSVYPNMLFIFPESMRCRYTCAMLDVFFDLGYVLIYLVMVVIGTTELHVNVSVWGNFGERSQLGFSNSISAKFAFPSEFLQYMAVYVSIAHVCCACRAVQRGQTPELEAARDVRPKVVRAHVRCPWVKRFLKYIYSPCLTALLVYLLICQDVYPGHRGDFTCFPCRCSAGRLQSCSLAAQLQQEQLVIAGVTSIEPQAFKPLGCGLLRLSLANTSITSLGPRSFEHLPCLQILDISRSKLSTLARDSFYGLEQLEVLSLHGNELHNISGDHLSHLPSLEKLLLGSKSGFENETLTNYELEAGNLIKFLPPRLFEGNPHLNYFDVSGNNITKVD